jgi:predicted nucleotidyltransferase
MLSNEDREFIISTARKYEVSSVILFGSSLDPGVTPHDIDLGVRGIAPALFFKFYTELFRHFDTPVDLVDLSKKTLFTEIIEENGIPIYG